MFGYPSLQHWVAQESKVYVQHLMARQGEELWAILSDSTGGGGGSIFVCGDGVDMAKAVHKTLVDIFACHGNMTEAEAGAVLANMATAQRYVKDVWS